ncbi:hypothetical protein DACRYDRAFT_16971 [Dacryopinax primogenitus]|uniref:Mid2 domain-containing protein n=1 Tax=Dacryopinax primogenitus (strain DJM 731) TaxID=1858805 RepID=M5G7V2_DACPD|nr:uncharacterized protein DACRYDRAFT_16971 [Dacryopinax primogenitus]EJT99852.1 hypothetical protein DACRYDRAFT_16971 [Dacryopinax primogenitus]
MVVQTNGPFNFLHFEIFVQSTQLLSNYTIQYNDPSIQYSGTWSTPTLNGLTSPTAQSSDPAAMMALNFTGVGVVMQASMDNNNGPYNIVFDGQTSSYTPNVQGWTLPPAILYYALDLQAGQHTLTMSNTGAGGSTLTLSSITIVQLASEVQTTTAPTGASISPTASANGSTADSGRTTNVGAIAGGVIGGIALLALLALVALLLLRRRRRVDPLSPTPFIPTMHTPLPPPSVLEKTTEASVITNTVTGASVRNPPASLVNDPDAQNEVVDRVLEILASRIDAHPLATTSGSSASEPPEYRDTRTASQRL